MVDSQSAVLVKPGGEKVDNVNDPGWGLSGRRSNARRSCCGQRSQS